MSTYTCHSHLVLKYAIIVMSQQIARVQDALHTPPRQIRQWWTEKSSSIYKGYTVKEPQEWYLYHSNWWMDEKDETENCPETRAPVGSISRAWRISALHLAIKANRRRLALPQHQVLHRWFNALLPLEHKPECTDYKLLITSETGRNILFFYQIYGF